MECIGVCQVIALGLGLDSYRVAPPDRNGGSSPMFTTSRAGSPTPALMGMGMITGPAKRKFFPSVQMTEQLI